MFKISFMLSLMLVACSSKSSDRELQELDGECPYSCGQTCLTQNRTCCSNDNHLCLANQICCGNGCCAENSWCGSDLRCHMVAK